MLAPPSSIALHLCRLGTSLCGAMVSLLWYVHVARSRIHACMHNSQMYTRKLTKIKYVCWLAHVRHRICSMIIRNNYFIFCCRLPSNRADGPNRNRINLMTRPPKWRGVGAKKKKKKKRNLFFGCNLIGAGVFVGCLSTEQLITYGYLTVVWT